jgi:cytochrome P450
MESNVLDPQPKAQPAAQAAPPAIAVRQLADLPGPKPWPLVGNSFQVKLPRLHLDVENWANIYGPIFKAHLGPTRFLIVSDHDLITSLLRDRPDGFRRPSMLYRVIVEMGIKPGVFSAEGQAWQNQRRMVMASFSPGNVRGFFPSLLRVTQRLQGRWAKAAATGQAIDLQLDLMRFTVDAISGLAFGKDINTLESKEEVIQQHLDKIFPALYNRVNALVPYWRWFKLPKDRALDRSIQVVNAAIKDFIAQARDRLAQNPALREHPNNLLEAMIVAADQPGSGVNDDDVAGNVFTLLLAGEDTTATSISWLIYLLSKNPQALARAREEAQRVVSGDLSALTPEKLADLNYIEACAHEAMRLKPVGPINVVEALKDTVVAGVAVPRKTLIICVLRHDAMSEKYFEQARAFKPERWLEGQGLGATSNAKRVSMPFGAGPRVCPGRYLALLEIKLAMAMLLTAFDIVDVQTPDGGEAQELMSFTMVPVGLKMHIQACQH